MTTRCLLFPVLIVALLSTSQLRADEASYVQALEAAGLIVRKENGHVVEVGLSVRISKEEPKTGWTPELLQRLPELPHVAKVHVVAPLLDNAGLEIFTKLPKLEALRIAGSKFDDAGFETIARCKSLKIIYFSDNGVITGKGITALKPLADLHSLGIADCKQFGRDGVQACAQLTQLTYLGFYHLNIGDEEMALLEPLAGSLKEFDVSSGFNGRMSEAGLEHLSKLKNLETLNFEETIIPFQNTLKHLLALPKLKFVNLDDVDTSKEEAAKLSAGLPTMKFKGSAASEEQVKLYKERREQYLKSR